MKQVDNLLIITAARFARLLPFRLKRAIYKTGPLASIVRSVLNKSAPLGLVRIEVAAGALEGMVMKLDLQQEKDYWLGTYEPLLQQAILELVRPGWVAYDIGANIGYVTLQLAQASGMQGKVIAFEALPENVERLRENISLNNMENSVDVVAAAVGNSSQAVRFLVGPSSAMGKTEGSAGRSEHLNKALEVPGLRLDDFIYQAGNPIPDVLKIDIEGGEVLALPGMLRLLEERHPLILMELHGPESTRAAWDALNGAGYRICRMAPGYPEVYSLEELDWKAYLVAFPKELPA